MPAFPANFSRTQEGQCVAECDRSRARNCEPQAPFSDFLPSASAAKNRESQKIEPVHQQEAARPGVADPNSGSRRIGCVERELEREQPRRNEKGDDEKT